MAVRPRVLPLLLAAAFLLIAVAVAVLARRGSAPEAAPGPVAAAPPAVAATEPEAVPRPPAPAAETTTDAAADDPLEDLARAEAWAQVDLEAVRDVMPNNLYWQLAVPTTDAALLREREEIRDFWNAEFGKVLAGTASVEEVDAYFEHRHRLSADYVEFTSHLLDHYGDVLLERDIGMLELARELHLARLEELPRRHAEALDRREAHAAVREAWLRDQALFEGESAEPDGER